MEVTDKVVEGRLAEGGRFRTIIQMGKPHGQETLQSGVFCCWRETPVCISGLMF